MNAAVLASVDAVAATTPPAWAAAALKDEAHDKSPADSWTATCAFGWEVHAEWFGSWTDGLEDERVRPFVGRDRLPHGLGLTQDAAAYFVDSSLGWRF